MEIKVKKLDLEAGIFAVVLHEKTAKELNVISGDRIKLSWNGKEFVAVVDISKSVVKEDEIGIFKELWEKYEFPEKIEINICEKPKSVEYIRKRLFGRFLSKEEIEEIVNDIMANKLSLVEKAYFVASAYVQKLSSDEAHALTMSMVNAGHVIKFDRDDVLDKHCIGGVPGNRVTPIIVPIIAAAGHLIPKTSSRAITSPAGTADVVEIFADVEKSTEELKEIVEKVNGAMVWGGATDIAPVDDALIKVRESLKLDPPAFVISSIMAKKIAVGSKHVLIDIPLGPKVKSLEEARELAKDFIEIGKRAGMQVKVIISDGYQPIGKGIGPALEARDVIAVLLNKGPEDLKNKALKMAGKMLEMVGHENGYELAKEILETGKAYKKFKEIVKEQGQKIELRPEAVELCKYKAEIYANNYISDVKYNNAAIKTIARIVGNPNIKGAGIYLNKSPHETADKDEVLATIYAPDEYRLKLALDAAKERGLILGSEIIIEEI